MSTMQLPPTQSSREVRSQCRSTVCRSCTWANLRQIAHSYWLRFWVYHKITDISIKTYQNHCSQHLKNSHWSQVSQISDPKTFAALGLFDAIVIIHRPKLGCPILIVSLWIFPKIPSSINLVYTQNNSTCQRINILLNQFPCNGCRMMLDACCKFIPALQQVAINILSSVKFMPGSCGHQLQLGLILMHSANGIRDIDIFDMWCVTDVYWQLISMILRCQRQT